MYKLYRELRNGIIEILPCEKVKSNPLMEGMGDETNPWGISG